jgi:glycosyltransferase involved in cell wall biosynthesis
LQCGVTPNWARPYICQVARFDPSKGIPCLLASYLLLRQKLNGMSDPPPLSETPQLIICGHGSVDDPDGQPIFEEIHGTLLTEAYSSIRNDGQSPHD